MLKSQSQVLKEHSYDDVVSITYRTARRKVKIDCQKLKSKQNEFTLKLPEFMGKKRQYFVELLGKDIKTFHSMRLCDIIEISSENGKYEFK